MLNNDYFHKWQQGFTTITPEKVILHQKIHFINIVAYHLHDMTATILYISTPIHRINNMLNTTMTSIHVLTYQV